MFVIFALQSQDMYMIYTALTAMSILIFFIVFRLIPKPEKE